MEKYHRSPVRDYISVSRYAGKEDFEVPQPPQENLIKTMSYIERQAKMPSEYEITAALKTDGKNKTEDELNCGSCGYNTCREKAIAIVQGKADVTMCLPFLKERAENFSDNIIKNTPNGILVLNESLEVQQINNAALKIINVPEPLILSGSLLCAYWIRQCSWRC